jgi:4-amino-4-deoxy-L-arabinose transferase-like glycosyltransferase
VLGALVALIVVSSVAHLWALHRDLPMQDQDEGAFVAPAVQIASTGNPNPHWFGHPGSTVIYPLAGFFHVWGAVAHHGPILTSDPTLTARLQRSPTQFYLIGRLWSIALNVGTLPLLFLVARRAFNSRVALMATALWAVLPFAVYHGQIVRTDSAAVFFGLLALWLCLRLLDEPRIRWGVLAGLTVGLAVSSRYFMVALVPVLVAAAVLPHRRAVRPALRSAAIVLGSALSGFVISTPYFFLDWNTTLDSLRLENAAPGPSSGGLSPLGNLHFYLGTAIPDSLTWPLVLLAAVGVLLVLRRPRRPQILLVAFCAVFLTGISVSDVHQQQWVIQILPVLLVFAAFAVDAIVHTLAAPAARVARTSIVTPVALVAITGALAIHPVATLVEADANSSTGAAARDWIKAHVPPGSRVVEDSIHVPLSDTRFDVQYELDPNRRKYFNIGVQPVRLDPHRHSLAYYERAGYQYVITNAYWANYFGRSMGVRTRYPDDAAFYQELACHARRVAGFGPSQSTRHGWPIHIYRLADPATSATVGQVKSVNQDSVTMTEPNGDELNIQTSSTTVIDKATQGSPEDITPGSTILLQGKPTYFGIDATQGEVLVLPTGSKFGNTGEQTGQVKAVNHDSITITRPNGKKLSAFTTSTPVIDKATLGSPEDITPGSTILVQGKPTHVGIDATQGEVLVLPSSSKLGTASRACERGLLSFGAP